MLGCHGLLHNHHVSSPREIAHALLPYGGGLLNFSSQLHTYKTRHLGFAPAKSSKLLTSLSTQSSLDEEQHRSMTLHASISGACFTNWTQGR